MAHECLGEVLRVLRQVINTYPLLNTVEILTAAGKLISKVKGQSVVQEKLSAVNGNVIKVNVAKRLFYYLFF